MKRARALSVGALVVLGVGAFASCREATQITLVVTTDAQCLGEGGGPTLRDTFVASAVKLPDSELVGASVTDQCTPEDGDNMIGTLVLVPGDGDEKNVEVVVIGGVDSASVAGEAGALALGADDCRALIAAGDSVQGKPCIVVRRRLGFVDHKKLTLPVKLDKRCIGVDCEEDKTCFAGNCVSADVDCDESTGECETPAGCDLPCNDACVSGSGVCEDGACTCLACDPQACDESCGDAAGVCNGDVCGCSVACDAMACAACAGTCVGSVCQCSPCDPAECGMTTCADGTSAMCTPTCTCEGCAGCENQSCAPGQLPVCEGTSCVCRCDDDTCSADCTSGGLGDGGSCGANDDCNCNPFCNASTCPPAPTIGHVFDHCDVGICHYRCDDDACGQYCGTIGGACTTETETGECKCSSGTGSVTTGTATVTSGPSTTTGGMTCMMSDCGNCPFGDTCALVMGQCDCECDSVACQGVFCGINAHPECVFDIDVPGMGSHCSCVQDPPPVCMIASVMCDAACIAGCQNGCALGCSQPSQPCACSDP